MKGLLIITLIFTSLLSYAQSNDVMAKAAFLKAQDLYGSGNYTEAIIRLDKVKGLLGSTNPRVEYLLTQSYQKSGNALKPNAEFSFGSLPLVSKRKFSAIQI